MIGILDYGVGNLKNVSTAVKNCSRDAIISNDTEKLKDCDGLILPGVGAFGDSINMLNASGLRDFLDSWVSDNKYVLGICVGMQMMFERSYEYGVHEGLGYLKGEVIEFKGDLKVPHMGWNELHIKKESRLLEGIKENDFVYFVHSFYAPAEVESCIAYTDYGVDFCAIVNHNNLYATQFHPEKSSDIGNKILQNYLKMVYEK